MKSFELYKEYQMFFENYIYANKFVPKLNAYENACINYFKNLNINISLNEIYAKVANVDYNNVVYLFKSTKNLYNWICLTKLPFFKISYKKRIILFFFLFRLLWKQYNRFKYNCRLNIFQNRLEIISIKYKNDFMNLNDQNVFDSYLHQQLIKKITKYNTAFQTKYENF